MPGRGSSLLAAVYARVLTCLHTFLCRWTGYLRAYRNQQAACDSVTAALSSVGFLSTTEVWSPSLASILEGEIDDDGQ